MRAVDAGEIFVRERLVEIEAQHFGAERRVECANLDALG
jgi:hypothetical protein